MEKIKIIMMEGCCRTRLSKLGPEYDDFLHLCRCSMIIDNTEPLDFMFKEDDCGKVKTAFNMDEEKRVTLSIGKFYEKKLKPDEKYFDILFTFSKEAEVRQISIMMKKSHLVKFLAHFSSVSLESM